MPSSFLTIILHINIYIYIYQGGDDDDDDDYENGDGMIAPFNPRFRDTVQTRLPTVGYLFVFHDFRFPFPYSIRSLLQTSIYFEEKVGEFKKLFFYKNKYIYFFLNDLKDSIVQPTLDAT